MSKRTKKPQDIPENWVPVQIYLPPSSHRDAKHKAIDTGKTLRDWCRDAVIAASK